MFSSVDNMKWISFHINKYILQHHFNGCIITTDMCTSCHIQPIPWCWTLRLLFIFSYSKPSCREHSGKDSNMFWREIIVVKISRLYAVKQNCITYPDLMYPLRKYNGNIYFWNKISHVLSTTLSHSWRSLGKTLNYLSWMKIYWW